MSGPSTTGLVAALLAGARATPSSALSPVEIRLLEIMVRLIPQVTVVARIRGMEPDGPVPPITDDMIGQIASDALRMAVEIEQPLRELRDQMEAMARKEP